VPETVAQLLPRLRGADLRNELAELGDQRTCLGCWDARRVSCRLDRDGAIGESLVALGHGAKAIRRFHIGQHAIEPDVILPAVPWGECVGMDAVDEQVHVLVLAIVMRDEQRLVPGKAQVG
jgi:hypothetical protein